MLIAFLAKIDKPSALSGVPTASAEAPKGKRQTTKNDHQLINRHLTRSCSNWMSGQWQ
jgi:hypothetical protein